MLDQMTLAEKAAALMASARTRISVRPYLAQGLVTTSSQGAIGDRGYCGYMLENISETKGYGAPCILLLVRVFSDNILSISIPDGLRAIHKDAANFCKEMTEQAWAEL